MKKTIKKRLGMLSIIFLILLSQIFPAIRSGDSPKVVPGMSGVVCYDDIDEPPSEIIIAPHN